MIVAEDAVRRAMAIVKDLTQDPRGEHALLEEIELVRENNSDRWAVTISLPPRLPVVGTLKGAPDKEYKVILIDAYSGDFVSMKIRSI